LRSNVNFARPASPLGAFSFGAFLEHVVIGKVCNPGSSPGQAFAATCTGFFTLQGLHTAPAGCPVRVEKFFPGAYDRSLGSCP
jgi:hypothetical protein